MEIGARIHELRKERGLSQEQLAEKVGVSRQTISKWELGETSPDIRQAKLLSQIFGVSLNELTDNNTKEPLYQKVSNTEKLAGSALKFLKILVAFILISIAAIAVSIALSAAFWVNSPTESDLASVVISESVGDEKYYIEIREDGTVISYGLSDEMKADIHNLIDFNDLENSLDNIEQYLASHREAAE